MFFIDDKEVNVVDFYQTRPGLEFSGSNTRPFIGKTLIAYYVFLGKRSRCKTNVSYKNCFARVRGRDRSTVVIISTR